jgi:uncharacterized Zn-binding protein involved in type VI secretion|tara:strand:+ start:180 stop:494 length:315 start_codon:yes stop_codon:yes gene_type:complete
VPAVARFGDVTSTGHGCSATTTLAGPSTNVFCNTKGVERKGDPLAAHTIPFTFSTPPGPVCIPHAAFINAGSGTVFVNGKPIARVGDSADSGAITTGSSNVFAG